jgi:hypothetical protein
MNVIDVLNLAEIHQLPCLKFRALQFIIKNTNALLQQSGIMESIQGSLWEAILQVSRATAALLSLIGREWNTAGRIELQLLCCMKAFHALLRQGLRLHL